MNQLITEFFRIFLKIIRLGNPFYQSLEELNINSGRNTSKRFAKYNLEEILKSNYYVLDIGCNSGFFSVKSSKYVKEIDAFDNKFGHILTGNLVKLFLGIKNINFFHSNIEHFSTKKKYDVVYSFAIHHWISLDINEYAKKLRKFTRDGGYLFFESHDLDTFDKDFQKKLNVVLDKGFKIENKIYMKEDGNRVCFLLKAL
ncbi:MAG: class I SAM-dependent methyltransferase [Promethearchaeota archaeon]|nr:MAG: class I SAM-dependent methyltransferase [Candidatus Lokiarchaeota archaeon]